MSRLQIAMQPLAAARLGVHLTLLLLALMHRRCWARRLSAVDVDPGGAAADARRRFLVLAPVGDVTHSQHANTWLDNKSARNWWARRFIAYTPATLAGCGADVPALSPNPCRLLGCLVQGLYRFLLWQGHQFHLPRVFSDREDPWSQVEVGLWVAVTNPLRQLDWHSLSWSHAPLSTDSHTCVHLPLPQASLGVLPGWLGSA